MWLRFLKECVVSLWSSQELIHINNFLVIPTKVVTCFPREFRNFILFATYVKFICILMSCSWSVACVCCCDWNKLWLLVILLKFLLIIHSWYPFPFSICVIVTFSLVKSFLFVIMEYALLSKEETTLSLQFIWWGEM